MFVCHVFTRIAEVFLQLYIIFQIFFFFYSLKCYSTYYVRLIEVLSNTLSECLLKTKGCIMLWGVCIWELHPCTDRISLQRPSPFVYTPASTMHWMPSTPAAEHKGNLSASWRPSMLYYIHALLSSAISYSYKVYAFFLCLILPLWYAEKCFSIGGCHLASSSASLSTQLYNLVISCTCI